MLPCRAKTFLQQAGYPDGESAIRAGHVTITTAKDGGGLEDDAAGALTAAASSLVFPGDTVSIAEETFRLLLLSEDGQRVTVVPEATPEMTALRLHFLPTGGRLVVSYTNSEQVSCYMPERRFALLKVVPAPRATRSS